VAADRRAAGRRAGAAGPDAEAGSAGGDSDGEQEEEMIEPVNRDPSFWPPPVPWPVTRRPPSKRRKRDCMGCGVDTSFATGNGHYYCVHDELWRQAVPDRRGRLCLDCLEARIRRPLVRADFVRTPVEIAMAMFPSADY
jgi:hypothetical protein